MIPARCLARRVESPRRATVFSLVFFLLSLVRPVFVAAQQPTIGVYLDEGATVNWGTVATGSQLDFYVVAFDPPSTLLHYGFSISTSIASDLILILGQDSPYLSRAMTRDLHFDVILPACATVGRKVLLGHVKVFFSSASQDMYFCLVPLEGDSAPRWMDCSDTSVDLLPATNNSGGTLPEACVVLNPSFLPPSPQVFPLRLNPKDAFPVLSSDFSMEIGSGSSVLVSTDPLSSKANHDISMVTMHLAWDRSQYPFRGVRQGPAGLDWDLNWQVDSTGVTVTIEAATDFIPHWNDPLIYLDLRSWKTSMRTPVTIDASYAEYADGTECPSSGGTGILTPIVADPTDLMSWGAMKAQYGE